MMTPYGPPPPDAYILQVPNECVGLVIGKNGDMIKRLQNHTGVRLSVATVAIPETNQRNVFVEGSLEKYQEIKLLIERLI